MVGENNQYFIKNVAHKFKSKCLIYYCGFFRVNFNFVQKKVTLRELRKGKQMVIADCFKMEFKLAQRFLVSLYI